MHATAVSVGYLSPLLIKFACDTSGGKNRREAAGRWPRSEWADCSSPHPSGPVRSGHPHPHPHPRAPSGVNHPPTRFWLLAAGSPSTNPTPATPAPSFNTLSIIYCSSLASRSSGPERAGVPCRHDHEAAEGPAGAAPDGQRRHGRHHARLPLRPHLHQGAILLQPLPQAGGGAGGSGGGRGLRQHAVQALRPHRRGGLRPVPPDLLQHQQALRAVRRRGRHPRGRQPLADLHQPSVPRVEDQAVRAPARPGGHGRRPRVHARPLRSRLPQRHRRPAALHAEPLRPGFPLLQRRVRGQPLPRLRRRAGAALRVHAPLRRGGPVPARRHQGLVGRQVQAPLPPALPLRRHRREQRPRGALLPADRHRLHLPPRHGHRRVAVPRWRDGGRLQARAPPRVQAGTRRGVAVGGAPAQGPAQAPHHLPQELAPVRERARHGARRRGGQVRRADRRAGQPHGHAKLRAAGELGGRHDGRARRRAHQHGVPAQPRRAGAGGAVRRAGVAHQGHLQGPRQGHGRHLHGVQRVAGGELAQGPLPGGPFLPEAPLRRAQEGLGRHQDGVPGQAERQAQPHQIHKDAGAGTRSLAVAMTDPAAGFTSEIGLASCIAMELAALLLRPAASASASVSWLVDRQAHFTVHTMSSSSSFFLDFCSILVFSFPFLSLPHHAVA